MLKLRGHLFEPVGITLDHPGVVMSKPLDRQYQAAVEVVVADVIRRVGAKSQLAPEVSVLFQPVSSA